MRPEHYNDIKIFSIFALVNAGEQVVYVGKSASPRLSAVYSRHICGRIEATNGWFSHEERPELYLLEVIECTEADAYKHVLAWIRVFSDAGYFLLNADGYVWQAESPLPDTQNLIRIFQSRPLDSILEQTKIARPTDADRAIGCYFPESASKKFEKYVQVNIRLRESDKLRLEQLRKKRHLTQAETICMLLDTTEADNCQPGLDSILDAKDKQIGRLSEKIGILEKQLEKAKNNVVPKDKKMMALLKRAANHYINSMLPIDVGECALKSVQYKKYMKNLPRGMSYIYPMGEGHIELSLEAILISSSRSRAYFIIGITEQGDRIKLRYFPREEYVGPALPNSPHAHYGSKWLFAYKEAPDGAKDIVAAFPMDGAFRDAKGNENTLSTKTKPTLDSIIARAEKAGNC